MQKWTREIMERYYGATPYHGWLGDEDEGQMGAWYLMAAIGLFETDGGVSSKPFYEIGSALFTNITIALDSKYYTGKSFVIEAHSSSVTNCYILRAELDRRPLNKPWFYHGDLVDGGKLVLEMGPKLNRLWGSGPEDAPPSARKRAGH